MTAAALRSAALHAEERFKQGLALGAYAGARGLERVAPSAAARFASTIWFRPLKNPAALRPLSLSGEARGGAVRYPAPAPAGPGAVVLVHGWAGSARQFEPLIRALNTAGRHAVAFDFPGHGREFGLSTDVVEMRERLAAVLRACEGPVDVVCHSFGLLVLAQALRQPGVTVRRLVSIASPGRFDYILDQFLKKTRLSPRVRPALLREVQKRVAGRLDVAADIDLKPDFFDPRNWLLVHDEGDREVPIAQFEHLTAMFPAAQRLTTTGLGHNRCLGAEPVLAAVTGFLGDSA